MRTPAITNQIMRRGIAGALFATAITAIVGLPAAVHADDGPTLAGPGHSGPNCQTVPWGFGAQRRTVCDGPISSDGSWSRQRIIWVPAHQAPYSCFVSGSSPFTNCTGGYNIDEGLISDETYSVRPDTVLPDEPGHLG
jgi:hypothetical protein